MPRKKAQILEEGKAAIELFEIEERVEQRAKELTKEGKRTLSLSEVFSKLRHTLKDVGMKRTAENKIRENYNILRKRCKNPSKLDKIYLKSMETLNKILASNLPIPEKRKLYHKVVVTTLRDMDSTTLSQKQTNF